MLLRLPHNRRQRRPSCADEAPVPVLAWRSPFRRRLALPGEQLRIERVLATARALLAVSALAAVYLDPTEPTRYAGLAYLLLVVYAAWSLSLLAWVRWRAAAGPRFSFLVHTSDILWAAALTLFTEGPNSPFFVLFTFVLLAAAYRWGLRESLATAFTAVGLTSLEALLVTSSGWGLRLLEGEFDLNRFILRAVYLLLLGVLLGYLAEEEKQLRAEAAAAARLMSRARVDLGLRGSLLAVSADLLRLFTAPRLLLPVQEKDTGRLFLWQAQSRGPEENPALQLSELDPVLLGTYFFPAPASAWAARHSLEGSVLLATLDPAGRRCPPAAAPWNDSFVAAHPCAALLGVPCDFGEEWSGRVYLLDPAPGVAPEPQLRALQTLVRQVVPAVYSVYLLRRLRARATAMERARVARELHDGAIQSLLAIELQVDVLRRRTEAGAAGLAPELGRIQELLRQQAVALRELMEQLKPADVGPQQLLDYLADSVEKFRRDTGIAASFISALHDADLPPRARYELIRILQEALTNIRKHSRARHVVVRLDAADGLWTLVVDDDGAGFPFDGRHTLAELDAARQGPVVIKERVRSLGGQLVLESNPGRGARLEVTLPRRAPA